MIDKDFINFYENWYYKKTDSQYEAREHYKGCINSFIEKTDLSDFIKKLSKKVCNYNTAYITDEDFEIITQKYPYIKFFHKEIVERNIKNRVIIWLFISAIKTGNNELCDYIINTYNLTEENSKTWELDVLDGYSNAIFDRLEYGQKHYNLKKGEIGCFPYDITYSVGDRYYVNNGERYILSDNLIELLKTAEKTFQTQLKCVLSKSDGYNYADFGNGRIIGFKRIRYNNYHFIIIKKSGEEIIRLKNYFCEAMFFLKWFDFKRWGDHGGTEMPTDMNRFPLYISAKESEDVFLEREIKYWLDVASQSEIDYLNQNTEYGFNERFLLEKDIYDLEDIEIIETNSRIINFRGWVYECKIIIDGKVRNANFFPRVYETSTLSLNAYYKSIQCKITDRLSTKIKGMFGL